MSVGSEELDWNERSLDAMAGAERSFLPSATKRHRCRCVDLRVRALRKASD